MQPNHRSASAGLLWTLPLLNKAPPHLTNNVMPFDAKACPLRSKPSRFSAILHNAYAYRSNPMPSLCHVLLCPCKTNSAFPSQINLNYAVAEHIFTVAEPSLPLLCTPRLALQFQSIRNHAHGAELSRSLFPEVCVLNGDYLRGEFTLTGVSPLTQTLVSAVVEPFLDELFVVVNHAEHVKLQCRALGDCL